MKVEINYDGEYKDSIIIEGETLKEISKKTDQEIKRRNWDSKDCWSEIIEE